MVKRETGSSQFLQSLWQLLLGSFERECEGCSVMSTEEAPLGMNFTSNR